MPSPDPEADARLMRLALALGRRNLGRTGPNPAVGAVVADPASGAILAQAATAPGGRPHAEPLALAAAGARARGATLYVSLEPCSHHGRSPPCADAIAAAGIARVVSAMEDPNPLVAGRGHAILRAAGIEVATGVLAAEAARDHLGHLVRIREGRPAVTLKLALTADGQAGDPGGPRLLITGEGANARTHMMRARADAILVGLRTVQADDPGLDVRLPGLEGRSPARLVLDGRLAVPPGSRLVRTARARPLALLCTDAAPREAEERLREAGAEILRLPAGPDGRVALPEALRALGRRGLARVFCEGGPALGEALAAAGLVDRLVLMEGPRPLGRPGLPALGPALRAGLAGSFALAARERAGEDVISVYERRAPCSPAS